MKIGLLTFPRLTNTFSIGQPTLLAQKLEPSVLYLSPSEDELKFIEDKKCPCGKKSWDPNKSGGTSRGALYRMNYYRCGQKHDRLNYYLS